MNIAQILKDLSSKTKILDKHLDIFIKDISKDLGINTNNLKEFIYSNCYIAGGCISSIYHKYPINDIDIFFHSDKAVDEFLKIIGLDKQYEPLNNRVLHPCFPKDANVEYMLKLGIKKVLTERTTVLDTNKILDYPKYRIICSNRAITFDKFETASVKLQFIIMSTGAPKNLLEETFDFAHNKVAYDISNKKIIADKDNLYSLKDKTIHLVNLNTPISTLNRFMKYKHKYGYTAYNVDYLKLLNEIQKLNLDDKNILRHQFVEDSLVSKL